MKSSKFTPILFCLFTFFSLTAFAQNQVTINLYGNDDLSTNVVDGPLVLPPFVGSTTFIHASLVDKSDNLVAASSNFSSPTLVFNNVPNGNYRLVIVENFVTTVGNIGPSIAQTYDDSTVTGSGVGSPIDANYPPGGTYTNLDNITINADTTITYGFTGVNLATVSGFVKDDNNVGIGGVTLQLVRKTDNSVAQEFTTVNTVDDISKYGEYIFENVGPGEYCVVQIPPSGFNTVSDTQSSDGDTTANTDTNDSKIPVTVAEGETDAQNNFVLTVPTNEEECSSETTESRFEWSGSAGNGNEWSRDNNTDGANESYTVNYTDALGQAQTIGVTVTLKDDGSNMDTNFSCPTATGCDSRYGYYTETNGFFGSGFLTLAQSTSDITQEVSFEFEFSKAIYVKNFSVSDIDWVSINQLNYPSLTNTWTSFQDEVTIVAENTGNPVALDYTVGSNLQLVDGNTVRSTDYYFEADGSGVSGDSSPSYPTNAVYVSSQDQVTKIVVTYRNGDQDVVTNNGEADPGHSDGHYVRLNGFTFCAVDYAALGGRVWEDTNQDNQGEEGISGVTITLYEADGTTLATKADGSAIGPVVTSDGTTDVDGNGTIDPVGSYYIPGLAAGEYIVKETQPTDYTTVTDGDTSSDGDTTTNTSTTDDQVPVTLTTGKRDLNNDFVEVKTSVLPIELVYFEAIAQNTDALLTWATASETNNSHFEIEFSTDGSNFLFLDKVLTQAIDGNSSEQLNYTYTQKNAAFIENQFSDNVYYRVKQVDFDGQYSYTQVRLVNFSDSTIEVLIHPNPSPKGSQIIIQADDIKTITLYNIDGQIVRSINNLNEVKSASFFSDNLESGVYFIVINNKETRKLIIQ